MHAVSVPPSDTVVSLKYLYASIILYSLALSLTKLAILILYRRIFLFRRTQVVCNVLIAFVALLCIESVLTGTFTCIPVQAFWDIYLKV